ncbi:helix-turn-helix transcriptional regulator [Terasakiella sp. A23]|uniref:helix-turn-helix domain-containing protein n=1 Tax=Terasakiella sp. FCG-A23 TaxID=3080561 RepID=UPI0029535217|nr:helix-turn-helix transcriptional regulator [Terasakiella sp. A23]MDV7340459.1 helix-turn-helix transcriptional regulator [Terasakiella sp. A23]
MQRQSKIVDPIDQFVGQRLRLKRELEGYSQIRLGEMLGVSRIKIGQFESGAKSIPAGILFQLTEIFQVNVAFFFNKNGLQESEDPKTSYEPLLNKESINLLKHFDALKNPDVRQAFVLMMERSAQLLGK